MAQVCEEVRIAPIMNNLVTHKEKPEHFSKTQSKKVGGLKQKRKEFGLQDFVLVRDLAETTSAPPLLLGFVPDSPLLPVPETWVITRY